MSIFSVFLFGLSGLIGLFGTSGYAFAEFLKPRTDFVVLPLPTRQAYQINTGSRAGYYLENSIYLGGNYSYFLGGSLNATGAGFLTAEIGYRFLLPMNVEAISYFGTGAAVLSLLTPEIQALFLANPGLRIIHPLGPIFASLDNRYFVTSSHHAFSLAANFGFHF